MAAVELQRTSDELKNPELNYYIAFKIDLKEIDKEKIELAIKKVLSSTGGSMTLRRLIELKSDIIQIMCNDARFDGVNYQPNSGGRRKEAEAAKAFKIRETVDTIQMLCQTRKTLFKSELITIYNTVNKIMTFFTEEEFFQSINFLTDLGVKVIDNMDEKIPFIDFEKAEKILESVKKKSLYEYLGLSATASVSEIQTRAKDIYIESQKASDLKKKQIASMLDGSIKKLLFDQQIRKSYDQYLLIKENVWDEFAQRKNFGIRELTISEYDKYAYAIKSTLDITIDKAEKILAIGCKYFQLTIVGDVPVTVHKRFNFCPYCGKQLNIQDGHNFCPFCGEKIK